MTPLAQILLVKLWLLASRTDGRLEVDLAWLAQRTSLPATAGHYLETMRAGFLVPLNDAARGWFGGVNRELGNDVLALHASNVLGLTDRKTDKSLSVYDQLSVVPDVQSYLDGPSAPDGRDGPREAVRS